MTMVTKIAIAVALAAFLAVPSASFAASKAKNSQSDVTQCQGGGCTAKNPDRDPNTSVNSQYYRRHHKAHKTPSKN
jgi:hypothetical protein